MTLLRPIFRLLLILALLAAPHLSAAADLPRLTAPPTGERWFSVNMDGERVGFAHQVITRLEDGYQMEAEGSVKMLVMGFSRDASSNECYYVGKDLSLRSFTVEQTIDGSRATLSGEMTPKGIKVTIESASGKKEKLIKAKGPVYPPPALNLLPLMQQGKPGKKVKVSLFDPEALKVKQVTVTVVGSESVAGKEAIHLKNNLYSFVDNDIWVDLQGNSIKESVRDDLVVTSAEDEKSARNYLANAAVAKKDLILDFSLIRLEKQIQSPERLKRLVVDFIDMPKNLPLIQGARQQATVLPDGTVRFTMSGETKGAPAPAPPEGYLQPAERIPSDNPEIVKQKDAVVGSEQDPGRKVDALVAWVAREIQGTVTDSQSPVETLQKKNGNCQSHARLYTAMARAAGVPSRFVSGVVYAPGKGFLYHSWAESYLNGMWVPVDPTFGQNPADLTHIKVEEGDTPDDMATLAVMVGKVKAKLVEQQY
ncbi:transglutaminase-like domain-containing protein [Geomonas sp. RF6]|uniref:transglutaminase-like domain-containing protein n=1 Tax=Geomonas sp. RF6 TaxID=2897342 RepID=UPI001E609359|nr:transglutaminase-like domain-containing protein [Geomonas sp. RF6]UFS72361.1 transglutaminase-like domain-containing protein [Geomonas sp. RF6]